MRLSQAPIFTIGGVQYYSFFLDINEVNNATDKYLSLDSVKIYTSTTPNQSTTNLSSLGTLRYGQGSGNTVALNYDLESGSGFSDMTLLVPVANFAGALQSDYVYLYSAFGALGVVAASDGIPAGDYSSSDGFEEWAFGAAGGVAAIPEPSSIILGLSAVAGFGGFARWRRRRTAK